MLLAFTLFRGKKHAITRNTISSIKFIYLFFKKYHQLKLDLDLGSRLCHAQKKSYEIFIG